MNNISEVTTWVDGQLTPTVEEPPYKEPSFLPVPPSDVEEPAYKESSTVHVPSSTGEETTFEEPTYEKPSSQVPAPVEEPTHNDAATFFEVDASLDDDDIEADVQPGDSCDSSDENDVDSDVLSEELEDIEGSSDDDIFVNRKFTKQDLMRKLKRMEKRAKRPSKRLLRCAVAPSNSHWYSDAEDDDTIENLDDSTKMCPTFTEGQSMKNRDLEVLMKFENIDLFRDALRDWLVRNGYALDYKKNERKRVTAKCLTEGCNWRIHASVVQGGPTFQIKKISGEHTCSKVRVNKHASSEYIGKRMEQAIKDNPDVAIHRLGNSVTRKVGVEAGYWKTLRAKRVALNKIRGIDAKEYTQLWDYCETVRSKNPGAKLLLRKVADSDPPVFERMYFSLPSMRMGFLVGCRPLIGLDGCFLKTVHGGQLLCAIGRDGNDNLFPIAMVVVPVENREAWTWFLGELLDEIGGVEERKWTFISDRQKGLLEAIKDLAPGCAHRFCVRHIYQNFKQKWSSLELKTMLWRAASTGNKNEFEAQMLEIQRFDKAAADYLRNIPTCHWARSSFSTTCKSDVLVNNFCESFNNYILEAREKPIISMFEWIRTRLTSRIQTKKTGMEKYEGSICPNIVKKINKCQQMARNNYTRFCGNEEFEVDVHGDRYVVNLDKRICTCGLFQMNGYPCHHAWSSIKEGRHKVEDYVDSCYKKDTYLKVYAYMNHAVPGPRDYIKTPYEPLQAPKCKRKVGRPTKLRRKAPDEVHRTSYRKGLTHTCKNCLQQGHNRGTCKNPTNPRSKFFKGNSATEEGQNSRNAPLSSTQEPVPHPYVTSKYAASTSPFPPHPTAPPLTAPPRPFAVPPLTPFVVPPTVQLSAVPPPLFAAPPTANPSVPLPTGSVYVGRRNEALLGRNIKFNKPRATNQTVSQFTAPSGGSSSTIEARPSSGISSKNPVRKRKLQIGEDIQNIRDASNKKRIWKI